MANINITSDYLEEAEVDCCYSWVIFGIAIGDSSQICEFFHKFSTVPEQLVILIVSISLVRILEFVVHLPEVS